MATATPLRIQGAGGCRNLLSTHCHKEVVPNGLLGSSPKVGMKIRCGQNVPACAKQAASKSLALGFWLAANRPYMNASHMVVSKHEFERKRDDQTERDEKSAARSSQPGRYV